MSFLKEFWKFLRARKKFWLLPILPVLMFPWRRQRPDGDGVEPPAAGNNPEGCTGGLVAGHAHYPTVRDIIADVCADPEKEQAVSYTSTL